MKRKVGKEENKRVKKEMICKQLKPEQVYIARVKEQGVLILIERQKDK
jgi:hypothetical protein